MNKTQICALLGKNWQYNDYEQIWDLDDMFNNKKAISNENANYRLKQNIIIVKIIYFNATDFSNYNSKRHAIKPKI